MKKFATILVLVFVLSVSIFADGEIPIGGKTCPKGQTCLTNGQIPIGGKTDSQNPSSLTDGDIHTGGFVEDAIRENVLYFLKFIF